MLEGEGEGEGGRVLVGGVFLFVMWLHCRSKARDGGEMDSVKHCQRSPRHRIPSAR